MLLRRFLYDVRALFARRQPDVTLEDEIQFHLEQQEALNRSRGLSPGEAHRQTVAAFGKVSAVREAVQDVSGFSVIDSLWRDVKFGVRTLVNRPIFSATVIATLALGIGASTAVFTVLNAVVLRPLPYANPDELVAVWDHDLRSTQPGSDRQDIAPANLVDWESTSRSFTGFAAYGRSVTTLGGQSEPEQVPMSSVSPRLFPLLGIRPLLGSLFRPDAGVESAPPAMIAEGLWRRRFGADSAVVGRTITLDAVSYTVIGIIPAGRGFPREAEVWTARSTSPASQSVRGAHFLNVIARLAPGVSIADARREMSQIASQLEQRYPATNAGLGVHLVPLHEEIMGPVKPALLIVFAAVAFVLIVACANVGGLFIARAAASESEIALRIALGASRRRIVQQLLAESLILSACAGVAGLFLAVWSTRWLMAISPVSITPASGDMALDARVVLFAVTLALITTIGFGVVHSATGSGSRLQDKLRRGGQQMLSGAAQRRGRRVLVASEIALTMILLTGAGLMVRGLERLSRIDLGFAPGNVFTAEVKLPGARYRAGMNSSERFYSRLIADLRATPGAVSAAAVFMLPFSRDNRIYGFRKAEAPGTPHLANFRVASAGYFDAMRVPIVRGRDFSRTDTAGGRRKVIINETMARRFWGDVVPIGRSLLIRGDTNGAEIVGIVRDVRYFGHDATPEPEMYVPHAQVPMNGMTVVVRTRDDPSQMAAAFKARVHAIDAEIAVGRVSTMRGLIDESLAIRRFVRSVLAGFAVVGLLLSCVGVYGLVAYSVAQRRREIGIRMAMGARPRDVLALITGEELRLSMAGIVAGLAGSLMLGRVLASSVAGVEPWDVSVLVIAAVTLSVAGLVASAIPAWRASAANPVSALRAN